MAVYSLFYYYGFRHQNNSYFQLGGDKAFINGVGKSVHYPIRLTLHRINLGNPTQLWFIYYRFCVSVVLDLTWLYLRCTYFFPHHPLPQPKKETKTLVYAVHTPFTYHVTPIRHIYLVTLHTAYPPLLLVVGILFSCYKKFSDNWLSFRRQDVNTFSLRKKIEFLFLICAQELFCL